MLNNLLAFLWWDCMPLFAVISPIVVDFLSYEIRNYRQQDGESSNLRPRPIFLVCLLALVVSSVLIFFATFLALEYEMSLWMCAMIISFMAAVFIPYRKMFGVPQRKKAKSKAGASILSCLVVVFLALNIYLLFELGFEISAVIVILSIIGIMIALLVLYSKICRERDQKGLEQTGRSFFIICFAIVALILAFPFTNLCIALPAGGWKYRWMEHFEGAPAETFFMIFGRPTKDDERFISYGKIPWFIYSFGDDQLDVSVENKKIKGFIWH